MSKGYHKECIDCCNKVISQYEKYNIEINYDLYFNFLFFKYVSLYYVDNLEAKTFVRKIKELIETNPFIKNEYNKNKNFYEEQFKYSL